MRTVCRFCAGLRITKGREPGADPFSTCRAFSAPCVFWGGGRPSGGGGAVPPSFVCRHGQRPSLRGRKEGGREQRRAAAGARSRRFAAPEKFLTALRMFFFRRRSFFFLSGPCGSGVFGVCDLFPEACSSGCTGRGRTDASFLCRLRPIFVAAGRDEAGKKRGARFFGPSAPRAKQKRRSFFIVH